MWKKWTWVAFVEDEEWVNGDEGGSLEGWKSRKGNWRDSHRQGSRLKSQHVEPNCQT